MILRGIVASNLFGFVLKTEGLKEFKRLPSSKDCIKGIL